MKKLLIFSLLCAFAAPALASQGAGNTGCGLGTVLWGSQSDGSVISQTLQATTNGILGNQTFGITSGTLGCDQPASIIKNDRLLAFTADNLDLLARDIATGQGETLDTVAELLEVPAVERPAVNATLQANFDRIFVTGTETAGVVLDRIAVIAL
jgi:hypothetical protein